MATLPEEIQATPTVATTPVAPAIQPVSTPQTILSSPTAAAVYDPINVKQLDVPSAKKAMDMKLSKLEKKLSKASSTAELNQINIMNQTKAMGVLTGEAAHQSRLDTAKLNAFNSLYANRLAEEERKEAERQNFIATYGADPNSRPKGTSKKEFAASLSSGGFSNLLTPEFKEARAAAARAGGGSTIAKGASPELAAVSDAYTKFSGNWQQTADYLASQGYDVSTGSIIDNELRRRNGLQPIETLTPAQEQANIVAQEEKAKGQANALKALDKVALLENHKALKTSVGVKGLTGGLLGGWVIPGTKSADFNAQLDALKSMLTIENLGIMKGVLSDADIKILREAATSINKNMSEKDFKDELARIKTILNSKTGNDPLGLGF